MCKDPLVWEDARVDRLIEGMLDGTAAATVVRA
jgi:hypothetical protein